MSTFTLEQRDGYTLAKENLSDARSWIYEYDSGLKVIRYIGHSNGWSGYVTVWRDDRIVDQSGRYGGMSFTKARAWRESGDAYKDVMNRLREKELDV